METLKFYTARTKDLIDGLQNRLDKLNWLQKFLYGKLLKEMIFLLTFMYMSMKIDLKKQKVREIEITLEGMRTVLENATIAYFMKEGRVYPVTSITEDKIIALDLNYLIVSTQEVVFDIKEGELIPLPLGLPTLAELLKHKDLSIGFFMNMENKVSEYFDKEDAKENIEGITLSPVNLITVMELANGNVDAMSSITKLLTGEIEDTITAKKILPLLSEQGIKGNILVTLFNEIAGKNYQLVEYLLEQGATKEFQKKYKSTLELILYKTVEEAKKILKPVIEDYILLTVNDNKDLD